MQMNHWENHKCISDPIPCKLSEIKAKAFFNLGMELLKHKIFPKQFHSLIK